MNPKTTKVALYVHIAFCETKCPYCDFNTYAGISGLIPRYLNAIAVQAASIPQVAPTATGNTNYNPLDIATIFFGGGTPSMVDAGNLKRIVDAISLSAKLTGGLEITLESNPNDVSESYLRCLREIGINRLSIGVQSFDDQLLRLLGRRHDAGTAISAFEAARLAGFHNVSLDLMFGLPYQSIEQWKMTLNTAIQLQPEHLSLYNLTIEANTPFQEWESQGRITLPSQDEQSDMYEFAMERLHACGYTQYEVSNWARRDPKDLRSQHNLRYWRNQPYIGLGAGSHSNYLGYRYSIVRDPRRYIELVESGDSTIEWTETIDPTLEMAETAMLGLRLNEGLSQRVFHSRFGLRIEDAFPQVVQRYVGLGLLTAHDDRIRLTRRGRLLGNEVFASFVSQSMSDTA